MTKVIFHCVVNQHTKGNEEDNEFSSKRYNNSVDD